MATVTRRGLMVHGLHLAALVGVAAAVVITHTPLDWVARSVGVGLAGGLAGGLIAGAIGLVSVPLITLFLGLPVHQAVATNLFQTIFTAASGASTHRRLGNVNVALAVPLVAGSALGAPLGAIVGINLSELMLRGLFTAILLVMAVHLLRLAFVPPRAGAPWWRRALERVEHRGGSSWWARPIEGTFRGHDYRVPRYLPLVLGAGIGFVSGLLGIGGGFLVTPLVSTFLQVPTHLAIGTGLVVISGNSLFGTAPHLLKGNVLLLTGVLISVGGVVGARVGSRLSHRLDERWLRGLFVIVLVVVAWRMSPW